jgi:hypothetical protein
MTDQLPPAEQHLLCFITFSVCDAEKASTIFRSTAQSILGLTVARENMVIFSCGLSALQGRKDWCSTLDRWMDGAGVKAHFAVKRLRYHLYATQLDAMCDRMATQQHLEFHRDGE